MSFVAPTQRCLQCGEPRDPNAYGALQEVTGFTERRRGGGVHHIRFRFETGRFLCPDCVRKRKDTGNAGQESLL